MANPAHPVGVTTNGIGRKTTAHLNLTRSLADVWFNPKPEAPKAPLIVPPQRPPYAGYDPRENRLW